MSYEICNILHFVVSYITSPASFQTIFKLFLHHQILKSIYGNLLIDLIRKIPSISHTRLETCVLVYCTGLIEK